MRPSHMAAIAIAAFIAAPALAQTQTPQTQDPQQPQTQQTRNNQTAAMQTFTGCLMREPDYRRAHNLGGGAMGGVGLGDEFVLVDVKVSPAKNSGGSSQSSDLSGAGGSSSQSSSNQTTTATKCADQGVAYRLTGTNEEKIKEMVGRKLEIQGRLKNVNDTTASGSATSSDKLPPEVEIVTFRQANGRDEMSDANVPAMQSSTRARTAQSAQPQSTQPTSSVPTREPSARGQASDPSANRQGELPKTASSAGLVALIGGLALSTGLVLTVLRRRRAL